MMIRSLYGKFALTTMLIMAVSSIFAFMFSNFYYQQKLKPYNDEKNTKIALSIAAYIEEEVEVNLERYLESIGEIGYQLYITNEENVESFYGDPFRNEVLSKRVIHDVLKGDVYHGMAEFPQETFVTGFFANELSNTIGVAFDYANERYALFIRPNIKLLFNEIHQLLAWLLILTIVLSVTFVLISTKYLIRPLTELMKATNKLAEGNFSIQLQIDREDEIGELAKSFTQMAMQLAKIDEMKSDFISNMSHDIQSPLSNIKGYAQLLENEALSAEERTQYLSVINRETNRLSTLTKQLLLLSTIDHERYLLNKSSFNLSEQLRELLRHHQWLIQENGLMLQYTFDDVDIYGDASLLYNVWENLLTNAIKYNSEHGKIMLSLVEKDEIIEVKVQDSGIGFDENVKERVFERFYREDEARETAGTGLGLSIVQSIVELHHGTISVESEKGKGTIFIVHLPKV